MANLTSVLPLSQKSYAFFNQAQKLVDPQQGIQLGDKLSWVHHSDGRKSPEIFKKGIGQEALRGFYSRFSRNREVDGNAASAIAIQWSLGYVSFSNRQNDGKPFYQDKLVTVFQTLAATYNGDSCKGQISQNYLYAARIIRNELREFYVPTAFPAQPQSIPEGELVSFSDCIAAPEKDETQYPCEGYVPDFERRGDEDDLSDVEVPSYAPF